jgi:flagella basal body P-ring formation protein FlgA
LNRIALVLLLQVPAGAMLLAAEEAVAGETAAGDAIGAAGNLQLLLARETAGIDGRVEISVGALDPRISLATCSNIEPFLPKGTRAWGKINVGIRCREGAGWTAFIPVTVRVFGSALAARKTLMSGVVPADNDVELVETEVSREAGVPVADLGQLAGKTLARAVFAGQILRQEYFRFPPAVMQGDQVKVVASGPGFSISADGEALSHALNGQNVRVKTDSGRIVSGIARTGRVVEMHF